MTETLYEYTIPLSKFNYIRFFALDNKNYIVFSESIIPLLDKSIEMCLIFGDIKQNSYYEYISHENFINIIKDTNLTEVSIEKTTSLMVNMYSVYFKSPVKNLDSKIIMIS